MTTTPYGSNFVPGDGPSPCDLMLIGEGPGARENESLRPFDGASGKLLDRLLYQNGLQRDNIYVTNLVKYHVPGDKDPSDEDIRRDEDILREEIADVKPRYVGLLGRFAARHVLGDIDLEWAHGLAFSTTKLMHEMSGIVGIMPMYHPAFGLHSTEVLPWVADDIHQFALMAKGKLEPRVHHDLYPKPKYKLLDEIANPPVKYADRIYIDTEGSAAKPWGLSYAWKPGEAYVILATNKHLLKRFSVGLQLWQANGGIVVLHNAMHDIPVLRAMGIIIADFIDTMVRSYHLCLEPQGLKPLARRHAGMEMQSYEEVIGAAARYKAEAYLERVDAWLNKLLPSALGDFSKTSRTKKKVRRLTSHRGGKRSATISRKNRRKSSRR